jgi:protein-L-isoaspartate(D-aspartate) O-methyltransferase
MKQKHLFWISLFLICLLLLPSACAGKKEPAGQSAAGNDFSTRREEMLQKQIQARGVADPAVLAAMATVERHLFVADGYQNQAYADHPLPIGGGQTISQPYVVALMTEALAVGPEDKVLEIGSGSGYQAAVLAQITDEVYSVEIKEELAEFARANLARAGCDNVYIRHGDGYFGWEEHAPFSAIIVTCAANHISPYLIEQLADGGRLIIPLGDTTYFQVLTLLEKKAGKRLITQLADVSFVPMTGKALE